MHESINNNFVINLWNSKNVEKWKSYLEFNDGDIKSVPEKDQVFVADLLENLQLTYNDIFTPSMQVPLVYRQLIPFFRRNYWRFENYDTLNITISPVTIDTKYITKSQESKLMDYIPHVIRINDQNFII